MRRYSLLFCALSSLGFSQAPLSTESYITPSRSILEAAMAPWWKNVALGQLSPDGKVSIVTDRDGPPPLARLARPYEKLGGLQVDREGVRERALYVRSASGLRLMDPSNGKLTTVKVPADARVSSAVWSPDSKQIAFMAHFENRSELWVSGLDGNAHRLTEHVLMPTGVTNLEWTDGGEVAAIFRPDGFSGLPVRKWMPSSPRVMTSTPGKESLRVFASLLQTPEDTEIYRAAVTGQLALVSSSGKYSPIGKPAAYRDLDASPKGDYVRITVLDGPVSYVVPDNSFGQRETIVDRSGKELVELSKTALQTTEEPPKPKDDEKRALRWRPDGAGLSFLQLGPADKDKKRKDRLMLWSAPFGEKDATSVYEQDAKISSVGYTAKAAKFTLTDSNDGKTRIRLFDIAPKEGRVVAEYKADESDKIGTLVSGPDGAVRLVDDHLVFFAGTNKREDAMKESLRPWIDRMDLADGKRTRIFEGSADAYETATLTDLAGKQLVVTRQSKSEVPNLFSQSVETKGRTAITSNKDYSPDLSGSTVEYVPVTRNDGMKFWVKVTMPKEGVFRRKAFFWFYPSEFKDQKGYDDSRKNLNLNTFNQVGGGNKTILLRAGYVLVEPDCPIFANYGQSNDSYVPQLRNNLSATIDELSKRDIIDREKLALGGHSYGAFSTMNAMVNTPFFKAGIAGDGNYNRSLTPFGFQSENRTLWLGRELYGSMSPILYADQLSGAVLMYHGGDDQNVGTALINSERMYAALESLGKTAALYIYPYEDHGQIAKETMLDQWARWVAWLDKYVK